MVGMEKPHYILHHNAQINIQNNYGCTPKDVQATIFLTGFTVYALVLKVNRKLKTRSHHRKLLKLSRHKLKPKLKTLLCYLMLHDTSKSILNYFFIRVIYYVTSKILQLSLFFYCC